MEGPKRNFVAEVLDAWMSARPKKISFEALAYEIDITWVTLNRLRRGQMMTIQAKTILKLAKFFQWGVEETGMAVWYSDQLEPKPKPKSKRERK